MFNGALSVYRNKSMPFFFSDTQRVNVVYTAELYSTYYYACSTEEAFIKKM